MSDFSYKDLLTEMNNELAKLPNSLFIGYGLKKGRALGTLKQISEDQIIEMPVAENLMIGFAIGLSLKGFIPIVFIERMDFILNALDAIVNHLDKVKEKSNSEFEPAIIIRCVVGNRNKPLYTGITHTQDHSEALKKMVSFPVFQLKDKGMIKNCYEVAIENIKNKHSTLLVEYKDLI